MNRYESSRFGRGFEENEKVAELDGLRVMFDQKVGLYPANLQKKVEPSVRKVPSRASSRMFPSVLPYAH
jgi:hypothetical protein